jgi:formylglycine-generating enzyme required for sulfatase activity
MKDGAPYRPCLRSYTRRLLCERIIPGRVLFLCLSLLLPGCRSQDQTRLLPGATLPPTAIANPSPTHAPMPTLTASPGPTNTHRPSPTFTPTSTRTPVPSPAPTQAPTAIPPITPTAAPEAQPALSAADCRAAGLPETACTGVSTNEAWTPVIREFDGVPMALVPAGCFTMGSTDEQVDYAVEELLSRRLMYADEQPAHEQCFAEPFWVDVYEVTNEQYGSHGDFQAHDRPREMVSWFESAAHCESRGARLPTEAQWEYAARGPDSLIFPWGNEFDGTRLNFCDEYCLPVAPGFDIDFNDGYRYTAPVGTYPGGVSWVGAFDMSGNVWEWVSGLLWEYPYRPDDGREVDGNSDSSSLRAIRGGAFIDMSVSVRAASRNQRMPVEQSFRFGFRCVRSLGP